MWNYFGPRPRIPLLRSGRPKVCRLADVVTLAEQFKSFGIANLKLPIQEWRGLGKCERSNTQRAIRVIEGEVALGEAEGQHGIGLVGR